MKHFIKEWGPLILFFLILILSRAFIWQPVKVDGHSMDPTLADGERLIVLSTTSIDRFDIVVAKETEDGKTKEIVKRVIGMPGDTITYKNDVLYNINIYQNARGNTKRMEDTSKKEDRCALCEINHPHPERVQFALKHKLDDETSLHLADLFKVLGDKTRIKLLSLLVVEKEMCVCDIAEALQMGQSAISHQLRVLRTARLVKYRKEGKEAWYSLDDDHVVGLLRQGLEHISHS